MVVAKFIFLKYKGKLLIDKDSACEIVWQVYIIVAFLISALHKQGKNKNEDNSIAVAKMSS